MLAKSHGREDVCAGRETAAAAAAVDGARDTLPRAPRAQSRGAAHASLPLLPSVVDKQPVACCSACLMPCALPSPQKASLWLEPLADPTRHPAHHVRRARKNAAAAADAAAAPAADADADAAAAAPPPAKRLKTLGAPLQPGVIRASLLAPDSAAALRAAHDSSGPYTHVVLKDLADPDLLRSVRDEVIHNVQATYKETDLFKVFQTGDLANLDDLDPESAAKLPSLMRLRDALYSAEFRG